MVSHCDFIVAINSERYLRGVYVIKYVWAQTTKSVFLWGDICKGYECHCMSSMSGELHRISLACFTQTATAEPSSMAV